MSEETNLVPVTAAPEQPDEQSLTTPLEREQVLALLGTLKLSADQRKRLAEPVDPAIVNIKPTGEPYVPAVHYRRKLNQLFRSWALRPLSDLRLDLHPDTPKHRSIMYREYALMVSGVPASVAMGEAEYHPSNERMTFGDAAEATRSNALTRLCKDLGLYTECWDPQWAQAWRREFCVQVWTARRGQDNNRPMWRRLDADPFLGEDRPTDDSPNTVTWWEQKRAKQPVEPDLKRTAPMPEVSPQERIVALRTIRKRDGNDAYGLKTEANEYFFEDRALYDGLEQLRLSGTLVRCRWEEREQHGRQYRWLIEVVQ